jgi:small subunit ribosomal protein S17
MIQTSKATRRILTGRVISTKMDKTINVCIERKYKHPKYEKRVTRSTNLLAHDSDNQCHEGDIVVIQESRPLSKRKAWTLLKVLEKAFPQKTVAESTVGEE